MMLNKSIGIAKIDTNMKTNTVVEKIMSDSVISLHPHDTLKLVDRTFDKHKFHHIPITDVNRHVIGIISKEDIMRLISIRKEFTDKDFASIRVKDFMSDKVVTIQPDDTVGLAADIFMTNHFHAIPVTEDDKLVGIVTTHDLIKYAFGDVIL